MNLVQARARSGRSRSAEAFQPYLKVVGRGAKLQRDLTYDEAREAMGLILDGAATDAQIGAFLIVQRVKGESPDEVRGFVDGARERFVQPPVPRVGDLLDLAAPYDGKAKTAQLSPAVALVLAAAGVPVLLHGGEGVPTKEGVTPGAVLSALGLPLPSESSEVARMVETVGVGYAGVRHFAPAWQRLLPIRRQLGLRTMLNTVEKLFNPAQAAYQVSGVFHANYAERIRAAQSGARGSWIVQGEEGSIEMATGRRTRIFGREPEADLALEPEALGLSLRERLWPGPGAGEHAALNEQALRGEDEAAQQQVALSAGTILFLLGAATDVAAGYQRANKVITSGAAVQRLALARRFQ